MITSNSMPISDLGRSQSQALPTPELINRLASEMRAVGDRELPLSFYAEQVKRKLANEAAANDDRVKLTRTPAAATSSVFHCWALPETV
ncbi:hypothetical protein [Agrobacterium rubi]|uniref:Uncharacterized protein n=1 Tax=Agrobacterium rubi TaxID=28099 RepID=A0AAE7R3F2_9HYPH|nr:hypothetical protein [Agrobacterium rubi]NTE86969.1 hypothetical protein [Agrobacterium rubi]NTF02903.1 hypothetical protein [Agrobacterium rubi]NTF08104.1 hypothetical protein [Agrobacterium rubi]NTF20332.1 hypothetical protein [Agrobacterium rubi]NTF27303.1 hypothetical protein [Agrobacterium rubi]